MRRPVMELSLGALEHDNGLEHGAQIRYCGRFLPADFFLDRRRYACSAHQLERIVDLLIPAGQ